MKRIPLTGAITLFAVAQLSAQVEPNAGTWRTWVIQNVAGDYRLPPPPSDPDTQAEAEILKTIAAGMDQTAADLVRYWDAGAPSYRWMQIARQEVDSHNLGGPAGTRAISLVAVAMNDATVAAWDTKYAYGRKRPAQFDAGVAPLIATPDSPSYPSEHAVTAAAAAGVLSYLFPDRKDAFNRMSADAGTSRLYAGTDFPSDVAAGMALGADVAQDVIAWAKADGSDAVFTGSFPQTTGVWYSSNPVFPLAGTWKPWALTSGSQLRLPPPAAFGSPEMMTLVAGVKNFPATVQTTQIAWFWQPSFIDPWIDTTNALIFERHIDRDPPLAARAYALETIAQHDASIACWDTKYAYLELRPVQSDPAIQPLFPTPQHPGYPSGHACASGAAAGALASIFPESAASLSDRAQQAGLSTFYGGVHNQADVSQGLTLGAAVADVVVASAAAAPTQNSQSRRQNAQK